MAKISATRVILGLFLIPPTIVLLLVLIAMAWPTKPLEMSEVFEKSCAHPLPELHRVEEREHSYSLATQGVWYQEESVLSLSADDASKVVESLTGSESFIEKGSYFERFAIGQILATCSVDPASGSVRLKHVRW